MVYGILGYWRSVIRFFLWVISVGLYSEWGARRSNPQSWLSGPLGKSRGGRGCHGTYCCDPPCLLRPSAFRLGYRSDHFTQVTRRGGCCCRLNEGELIRPLRDSSQWTFPHSLTARIAEFHHFSQVFFIEYITQVAWDHQICRWRYPIVSHLQGQTPHIFSGCMSGCICRKKVARIRFEQQKQG